MKKGSMLKAAVPLAILLMALSLRAHAGMLEVGEGTPYACITDAIDAAGEGDTILVYGDMFAENLVVNKGVIIQTARSNTLPILMPKDPQGPVVVITADSATINSFAIQGSSSSGVLLNGVKQCTISNNRILNNTHGITLEDGSSANGILHNEITNSCQEGVGISSFSNNNRIEHNTFAKNNRGVCLRNASDNIILDNEILNSRTAGVALCESSRNSIIHNEISHTNSSPCIELTGSVDNIIMSNTISNKWSGIRLDDSSNGNYIYMNFFAGTRAIAGDASNIWHSPDRITYMYRWIMHTSYLGNYWSLYAGRDRNGDGIGDEYHFPDCINEHEADAFPLILPLEHYIILDTGEQIRPTGKRRAYGQ